MSIEIKPNDWIEKHANVFDVTKYLGVQAYAQGFKERAASIYNKAYRPGLRPVSADSIEFMRWIIRIRRKEGHNNG